MALHPELEGKRYTCDDTKEDPCPSDIKGKVYLILDGARRWIPNPATYNNLFRDWNGIEPLSQSFLREIDEGTQIADGAVLVNQTDPPAPAVYLITEAAVNTKRHIASPATADKFHFDLGKIVHIPKVVLDAVPTGPEIV